MHFSTMQTGIHTAPVNVVVPLVHEGRVGHAVSLLHLILLINLSFAFTLIILS
jgi:hypothetical protein